MSNLFSLQHKQNVVFLAPQFRHLRFHEPGFGWTTKHRDQRFSASKLTAILGIAQKAFLEVYHSGTFTLMYKTEQNLPPVLKRLYQLPLLRDILSIELRHGIKNAGKYSIHTHRTVPRGGCT